MLSQGTVCRGGPQRRLGAVHLRSIDNAAADTLRPFVDERGVAGTTAYTDGWRR